MDEQHKYRLVEKKPGVYDVYDEEGYLGYYFYCALFEPKHRDDSVEEELLDFLRAHTPDNMYVGVNGEW